MNNRNRFPSIPRAAVLAALTLALPLALAPPPAPAQTPDDDTVVDEIAVIAEDGRPRRLPIVAPRSHIWQLRRGGFLGVDLLDLTPELRAHFGVDESAGVMVASVVEDSAADRGGLRVGDIVTAVDGEAVTDRGVLASQVGRREKGDTVSIEVRRDGRTQVLPVTVDERNRPQLFLSSLDEDGSYAFEWSTEDGPLVLPAPPGGARIEIEGERIDRVMGRLHERLADPDFKARMFEFNSNTEELERRIKELEQRLAELSKQLEALED